MGEEIYRFEARDDDFGERDIIEVFTDDRKNGIVIAIENQDYDEEEEGYFVEWGASITLDRKEAIKLAKKILEVLSKNESKK